MTATATRSTSSLTVEFQVHFQNGERGAKRLRRGQRPVRPQVEPGQVPRISRLMALAIHFDHLIRSGAVVDYADLARLGHVTRARITQIMDLLNLAPDIQEEILHLPRTKGGRDTVTERSLRELVKEASWPRQRDFWQQLNQGS